MSTSKGTSSTTTTNRDGRVAGDNGAIGVSSEGDVKINVVADEAFELGGAAVEAVVTTMRDVLDAQSDTYDAFIAATSDSNQMVADTLSDALFETQSAGKSEAGQIGEQLVKVAIPAAVIGFVALAVLGK